MKTILYHAITTYHLLEFMVHNLYYHHEQAVLIVPQSLMNFYPDHSALVDLGIFTDVIVMPDIVSCRSEEDIVGTMDDFVREHMPYLFDEDVEIHLAGAQFYFSVYLIHQNIPFVFYEEASGILSRSAKLRDNVSKANALQYELADQYGMFDGNHPCVLYKVCNMSAQTEDAGLQDAVDFNVVHALAELKEEDVQKIISFFTSKGRYEVEENCCLVLTQHFANLSLMEGNQQILLYQVFCDYFLPEYHLLFKPHPFDFFNYEAIFEGAEIIRERLPSELLPFLFGVCPRGIATVSSTSIYDIKTMFSDVYEMDFDFESAYVKMHRYFAVEKYIRKFLEQGYRVNLVGFNNAYLKIRGFFGNGISVYPGYGDVKEIHEDEVCFVDGDLKDADIDGLFEKNIKTIFMNSDEKLDFYRFNYRERWDDVEILLIKKEKTREKDVYSVLDDEKIYLFGNKGAVRMENHEKDLKYTGIHLKIECCPAMDYEKLALEGKLRATEQRLLYYIEKCSRLEGRVDRLVTAGLEERQK